MNASPSFYREKQDSDSYLHLPLQSYKTDWFHFEYSKLKERLDRDVHPKNEREWMRIWILEYK